MLANTLNRLQSNETTAALQGLRSGNYTFQVQAIDAAGNVGAATQPYSFVVDDTLPIPGAASASWFSGWHKWAVIGGAAGLVALLVIAAAVGACVAVRRRRRLERLRSEVSGGAGYYGGYGMDRGLAEALRRSAMEQGTPSAAAAAEAARMRAAIAQSMEVKLYLSSRISPSLLPDSIL